MVLKLEHPPTTNEPRFENDVKMYGTQTVAFGASTAFVFENDVKMYGTQTAC